MFNPLLTAVFLSLSCYSRKQWAEQGFFIHLQTVMFHTIAHPTLQWYAQNSSSKLFSSEKHLQSYSLQSQFTCLSQPALYFNSWWALKLIYEHIQRKHFRLRNWWHCCKVRMPFMTVGHKFDSLGIYTEKRLLHVQPLPWGDRADAPLNDTAHNALGDLSCHLLW